MGEHDNLSFMHCDFTKLSNEKLVDYLYDLGNYESAVLSFEMESFYNRVNQAKNEMLKRIK